MAVFDEIGDGIFRRRYELLDQNVGVIIGGGGVLVIDTRSAPSHGAETRDEIAQLTSDPVVCVVNTHWHWDHVLGNSAYPGVRIVGHERTAQVMRSMPHDLVAASVKWIGPSVAAELNESSVIAPDDVFADSLHIDLGDRKVLLAFHGKAHTDADISVRCDGVLFAGDLLEQGAPPAFADAYPLQWPATLARHLADQYEIVVPGHGDVMSSAAAETQLAELRAVAMICSDKVDDTDLPEAPYPDQVMAQARERAMLERA